jgi:serine/threonine protein phosphatase PrpC
MNTIKITTASATDIGASRTNQDRFYTTTLAERHTTCAVFDGHGTYGEEVAMWCVEFLAAAEEKPLDSALFSALNENIRERLRAHVAAKSLTGLNVYERQEGLYNTGSNTPIRGGTTASILRIDHMTGAITCASVGDSDVRVYDLDTDDEGVSLMADHTPTNPAEYERVLAFCAAHDRPTPYFIFDNQGGRLSAERRPVFVRPADTWELNPAGGFFHCDIRESWGAYFHSPTLDEGIAMTRAIGDFHMARFGLSHEPHVVTGLPPRKQAVICASDGFWDFVTYSEVRGALRTVEGDDAEAATAALMELAKERTRAALEGSLGDNITVTVTFVTVTPPPPQEEPPAELDMAFLLSSGTFRPESLFADGPLGDISFAESDGDDDVLWGPAVMDMSMSLPAEIMALPGSTASMLRVDTSSPEARWLSTYRATALESLEADHPLHCHLHRSHALPGPGLRRSRNSFRSYGSYAPPCSGCRIGAEEEAADAADDAELKACTEWLNLRINGLSEASIAGLPTADRRAEVEGGMVRLEICNAWPGFGDPAVMRFATVALAADDAAADIRRAMSIISEAKDILKTATSRLRATPMGAGYAAYKDAMAFLETNP